MARAAGFDPRSAAGDATALLALIKRDVPAGPLLHLHGRESRGHIADALNSAGIETHEIIVYAQMAQRLTPAACQILAAEGPVILPLFSPRTATLFCAEVGKTAQMAPLMVAALSMAVVDALSGLRHQQIEVADRPDAEAMMDAIGRLLDRNGRA